MNEFDGEERNLPDEDVRASIADQQLQREHRLEDLHAASRNQMEAMKSRALAQGASPRTEWIYFESPQNTWEGLCGRAGWLLYDPESRKQYEFLLEVIS